MTLFDLKNDLIQQFLAQPIAQMRIKHLLIVYLASLGFTYLEIQEITGIKENSIKTIMRRHAEQKEIHSIDHPPISYTTDRGGLIQLSFLKNFLKGLQNRYQPDFNEQVLFSHINWAYPNSTRTYPDIKEITERQLQLKVTQKMETEIERIPNLEAEKRMDEITHGSLLAFFLHGTGPVPLLDTFNDRVSPTTSQQLADRALSIMGWSQLDASPRWAIFRFMPGSNEKYEILVFSFATVNPDSPDKRNNYTLSFTIRSPWWSNVIQQHPEYFHDNFYSNLSIFVKQIRNLLQHQATEVTVLKEMVNAQFYITKALMLYDQFEKLDFNIRIPFTTSGLLGSNYDIELPANLTGDEIRSIRDSVRHLDPK